MPKEDANPATLTGLNVLKTPAIAQGERLLADIVSVPTSIGVLYGTNGSGKSECLRSLDRRYTQLGHPGKPLRVTGAGGLGITRGVKDLLAEFGVRESRYSQLSLKLASKIAHRELAGRQYRALFIDDAHDLSRDALHGILAMITYCVDQGHPVSLLLASASDPVTWLKSEFAGKSRVLRVERIEPLSFEQALGVLREWIPDLRRYVDQVNGGDQAAAKLGRRLYRAAGDGNLRRLGFLAKVLIREPAPIEITSELLTRVATSILTVDG